MTKRADWSRHVAEWKASGLSGHEFSEGREFSAQQLYSWSSKLSRPAKGTVRVARVLTASSQSEPVRRWMVEVTRARVHASDLSEVRTILETALGPAQ